MNAIKWHRDVRTLARWFRRDAGPRLALGVLLASWTVLAGVALLGLSGWFITATALAGLASASALAFNIFLPSAGVRLLALGRTAGRYAERLVTHDATLAVLAGLRERLFRGWARPEAARALLRRPARLLFRLTADIDALESLYLRLLVPLLTTLAAAVLTGVSIGALLDWRLGLAAGAWLLIAGWGVAALTALRARPAALRRAVALERLRERAIDLVAGQTDLLMAGRLPAQRRALLDADARLARADRALHRREVRAAWWHGVAGTLLLTGVLLGAGALAGAGQLAGIGHGAPLIAMALLVALAAMEPFSGLRRGALEAARAWLASRRLAPRLRADTDLESGSESESEAVGGPRWQPVATPEDGDALWLLNVTHRHAHAPAAQRPALRGVALRLVAGERVAVIGPSGSGKSTLLQLAAGELSPSEGAVRAIPSTWLTQRTELFQDSLRENLRLADPAADDDRLWAALSDAGLATEVRALARGLDTPLGEGGLGLSGGQSRRLALARLLLRPSRLWLLDEPTEGLDAPLAADVLDRLETLAADRAVLIATHLRREAALADRLLVLDAGRVVLDARRGTPPYDQALRALRGA